MTTASPQPSEAFGSVAQLLDHVIAIVAFVAGSISASLVAVWKLAQWTQAMELRFEEMIATATTDRETRENEFRMLREQLAANAAASQERHANVLREIDHMRTDVVADRLEIRAVARDVRKIAGRPAS